MAVLESTLSLQALQARLEALEAENAKLRATKASGGSIKVTEKGAISVYGHGRFPTTLYASQWEAVLGRKDEIIAFIKMNEASISRKPAKE